MESGKIFGFMLLLLVLFGITAGIGWLGFSGTKTGVPFVDQNVAKLQAFLPSSDEQSASMTKDEMHDGDHSHGADTHMHGDHSATTQPNTNTAPNANDVPGKTGQTFIKPESAVLGVRGVGNPNAPVQVREFYSLTCNHCAAFHEGAYQNIKRELIDTGKLYFIFEEFPLNGPALYGSMIARCMPEDRYESFVSLLLKNQDQWAFGGDFKSALKQNAALAGMSEDDFETCFNNKALQTAIAKNIQVSSDTWKISSTPSFVFNNGERVLSGGRSLEDFQKVIALLNNEPVVTSAPAPAPAPAAVMPTQAPKVEVPALEDTSININDLFEQ